MSGQWLAQEVSDTAVHTVPLDDVIVHDFAADCPCGPTARPIPREGRPDGWVHTHHSLDGREFNEPDHQT
ncbi:hypothetical protein [Streptomyces scabiei]|uniref:hypothetical protein n=1 Tax=Streptomyces scabiei TaxID=1930 RepID=UPI0029BE2C04|nr:hypothetical protein [Streptomyces scabiei]MDX3520707.1 hypothetical protein [Streptomyces scabiei]